MNVEQLRDLCRYYKIPLNGAKNKKELQGRILERIQMFKPELPADIYINAFPFLSLSYRTLSNLRLCCKLFYNIINDEFWEKKIKIDLGITDVRSRSEITSMQGLYVRLALQNGVIECNESFIRKRKYKTKKKRRYSS
jgi:hypothetical protein